MGHNDRELPGLPCEIFLIACSYLSPQEARSLRLCSKIFANIGACRGFEQITFFLYGPDLEKLHDITNHPIISKNVKTIVYEAAILEDEFLSFEQYREKSRNFYLHNRVKNVKKNWIPDIAFRKAPIDSEYIQENYLEYKRIFTQQALILEQNLDFEHLKAAIPKLRGLREIEINNARPLRRSPFDAFFARINWSYPEMARRQVEAVMHGLKNSGIQLHTLRGLKLESCLINPQTLDIMAIACGRLKSINLEFLGKDTYIFGYISIPGELRASTQDSALRKFFSRLPNLEVLDLKFIESLMLMKYPVRLYDVITPGFVWANLREICLHFIESER
ncbi:uncharacterized protein F4822DRAFT_326469 [Hypoxylon trugodes]|uniref:uncharacterized protein n=1 Tax=Hypoxylon trugodes TaxID=326681 RepID=UPI00219BE5F7|nr:uncharacterized protein F4822DRAFT_326469 [Hypoxylon trugodes]KAI1386789.1 hypothetical protein F4822DRAFT_326469 [Hypoxylon trugodes]